MLYFLGKLARFICLEVELVLVHSNQLLNYLLVAGTY